MDPYSTLGVAKTASQDEIKKAYRRLAMEFHPDRNESPDAEEKFKKASEAYSILGDENSRREYDESLRRPNPRAAHAGFEDFFSGFTSPGMAGSSWDELFGGFRNRARQRPFIIRARCDLSLEDIAFGAKKTFELDGTDINFRIPKPTRPGQTIRVGLDSGQELHASVHLLPHPHFELKGDIIHGIVEVPVETAIRGGEVKARTLDGFINLKIPKFTSSHSKLRVKGIGLTQADGTRASIIYEIKIVMRDISPDMTIWATSSPN